ncbi:MAG: hypothetical protein H6912_07420 [Kordiimonadaceae bacterium]|nr:hypothetical protein [Kordiimonadaceae bacterium]
MFGFLFKEKRLNDSGQFLFLSIIEQSRLPFFYTDMEIADSIDGRFDVLVLHMAIVLDELDKYSEEVPEVMKLRRILQEIMFDNLDLTLREIGVGDLGVGKKIKIMAEAFYGRVKTYQELFSSENVEEMSEAIKRNVYRGCDVDKKILKYLSTYIFKIRRDVSDQPIKEIMKGNISFLKPLEIKND